MHTGRLCFCRNVHASITKRKVCVYIYECDFVHVTWPCQSIFPCKPFHRQLPAPDPEIQWPHPQTAVSACTHMTTCTLLTPAQDHQQQTDSFNCLKGSWNQQQWSWTANMVWILQRISLCRQSVTDVCSRQQSVSVTQAQLCHSACRRFPVKVCSRLRVQQGCSNALIHNQFDRNYAVLSRKV